MNEAIKINTNESPCLTCNRVRDPGNCENKLCKEWQAWFIARWEAMRVSIFNDAIRCVADPHAITVGGHKYSHPDHVRRFLKHKPCMNCDRPEDLCKEPCALLVVWEAMKEKAVK